MLKNASPEFAEYFLLSFTEAILKNSIKNFSPAQENKNPLIPQTQKIHYQKSRTAPQEDAQPFSNFSRKFTREPPQKIKKIFAKKPMKNIPGKEIKIPEPKLPEHLQYIKPIPEEASIQLGSLDPFIKDPGVKIIQCDGPDERIIVKGVMGVKPTAIILREDEINSIIEEFGKKSKIPVHDGVYRVAVGRLVLSAIISTVIPPRFIIEKMKYPQQIKKGFPINAR